MLVDTLDSFPLTAIVGPRAKEKASLNQPVNLTVSETHLTQTLQLHQGSDNNMLICTPTSGKLISTC